MESSVKKLTVRSLCAVLFVAAISFGGQAQAGLIAEYSFDETSGTVAHDSVGSVNGNLLGGATFAPGAGINGSGAISLNRGTSDLVDMGNNFWFSSFSVQSWVKIPDGYATVEVPFGKHVAGAGIGPYVSISEGSAGTAHFYPGAYPFTPYSPTALNDGQWHQIVAVLDGTAGVASLYIDGSIAASVNGASTQPNTTDFLIGGTTAGPTFNGFIDDVRVYDNALTAGDVRALYSDADPSPVPEPTTVLLLGLGLIGGAGVRKKMHR